MSKNQFRRDPVSGQWSIIIENEYDVAELLSQKQPRKDSEVIQAKNQCQFCEGFEAETPSEIYSFRTNASKKDEAGWLVRVIPNKQPFLQIYGDLNSRGVGLYDVLDGIGAHELVLESPVHNKHMYEMNLEQIQNILAAYRERILDLKRDNRFRYVMVHKNYGEGDEKLKDHCHSHIIATPITPARVKSELMNAMEHYKYKERCLFCDIINQEVADDERIVAENEHFLAFCPFASRSPFEVWILPRQHETFFEWNSQLDQLAAISKEILGKIHEVLYDPNFVMVLHSGPNISNGKQRGYWKTLEKDFHWHIEITPRFRGHTSFTVGSGFQINVISPERATEILKSEKLK